MKHKINILIVEDEETVAEELRECLHNIGYGVSGIASSGNDALEKAKKHNPDMVLLDVDLKGREKNLRAASMIRNQFDIPVVFLTSFTDTKTLERLKKVKPYGFIEKPLQAAELKGTIKTVLYNHSLEKKVKQNEAWLSTILFSIGDAVLTTDKFGKITFMNQVAEKLTGWNHKESKGKPLKKVFQIITDETGKPAMNPVEKVLQEGTVVGLANHTILIQRGGKHIPIADSGAPIKNNKGEIIGIVLVFRDDTERRSTERTLKRTTRALKALSQCNQIIIRATDEFRLLGKVCKAIVVVAGYQFSWVGFAELNKRKTIRPVAQSGSKHKLFESLDITWAGTPGVSNPMGTAIQTGKSSIYNNILTDPRYTSLKDEAIRDGYASLITLPLIVDKKILGVLNIYAVKPDAFYGEEIKLLEELADDLAFGIKTIRTRMAHKQTLEALRESEERIRLIFDGIRDMVFIADPVSRQLVECNETALTITGYTREQLLSMKANELHPPDKVKETMEAFVKHSKGELLVVESEILTIHKKKIPVNINTSMVVIGGKKRLVGIFRDITDQKKMERELIESEERYRSLFHNTGTATIIVNQDGIIFLANEKCKTVTGYDPEKLKGSHWADYVAPKSLKMMMEFFKLRFTQPELAPSRYEASLVNASGEFRDSLLTVGSIPKTRQIIVSIIDITERKRMELALQENEEKLRNIFENSTNLFYSHTPKHLLTYLSPQVKEILGYDSEEAMVKWTELASDNPINEKGFELTVRAIETGKPQPPYELELVHKNGNKVWVEVREAPVVKNGKTISIVGALTNITERKRAEELLRESEKKFRKFFENGPEYCYMISSEGIILDVNKAAIMILGYEKKDLVGKHLSMIYAPESMPKMEQLFKRWQKTGTLSNEEITIMTKKGQKRTVLHSASAEKDKYGNLILSISVQRDITELRRTEKIQSAAYRISEAAIATEDLNSLYSSIHGIISELIPADNFYIALYDSSTDKINFPYFVDKYDEKPISRKLSKGLTDYVLRTGKPLLATPKVFQNLVQEGKVIDRGAVSVDWLGIPLKIKSRTFGVIAVQSYSKKIHYSEEEKNILIFISSQIAMVIERFRAEAQIRKNLTEKEILLKEIHHRVKNNMQIICSLLNLQHDKIENEKIIEVLEECKRRVYSMALVHEKLYSSKDMSAIDLSDYLNTLIQELYNNYTSVKGRISINVKTENININLNSAIPFGLVVSELISNAFKHAFPHTVTKKGRIEVAIRRSHEGIIELIVSDNGVGLPECVDFMQTNTMGLHLVRILVKDQLGGSISIDRRIGTKYTIYFKD